MHLVATRRLRYGSRAFSAGDRFTARSERDAKLLVYATKKAKFAEPEPAAKSAPAAPPVQEDPDIERLRLHAERLGIRIDRRWGTSRLTQEIETKATSQ